MKHMIRLAFALTLPAILVSACTDKPAGGPAPAPTPTGTGTVTMPPPGPNAPSVELVVPTTQVTNAAPLDVRINLKNFANTRGLSIEIMENNKALGRAFDSLVTESATSAYQLYTFARLSSFWNRKHVLTARVTDADKRVLTSLPVDLDIAIPNLNLDGWTSAVGSFQPIDCPISLRPSASSQSTVGYEYGKFYASVFVPGGDETVMRQRITLLTGSEGVIVRALVGNPVGDGDYIELQVSACDASDKCTVVNSRRSSLDFRRAEIDEITVSPPIMREATTLLVELHFRSSDENQNPVVGNVFVGYLPKQP
jgi:hypothetical protein